MSRPHPSEQSLDQAILDASLAIIEVVEALLLADGSEPIRRRLEELLRDVEHVARLSALRRTVAERNGDDPG